MSSVVWAKAPATVNVHVAVTGGFPPPDVTVEIDVAGPDLVNPNPTNFVNGTPQTQKAVAVGSVALFQTVLQNVGYYAIRVSATLANTFGSVPLTEAVVALGVGAPPSGSIS